MTHRRHLPLYLVGLLIITVGLACGPRTPAQTPSPPSDEWSPPGGRIAVSQEAADRLKENFNREMQEASTGTEFRLFITNEELTSLVALSLQNTGSIPLTDPQVWFTAGHIYITGTFSPFWPLQFRSLIVATPVVHDGQIVVKVERAQMGPFPFPQDVLNSASQSINETLVEMQLDLQITALQVLEGELQLAGTRRAPATPAP